MPQTPEQMEALRRLQSRRSELTPEQRMAVDRLSQQYNMKPSAPSIPAGAEIKPPLTMLERIRGWAKPVGEFIAEEGPPIVGAMTGAALGAPLGPGGIISGAAFGAGGARAGQRLIGMAAGERREPEELANDISRQMILGAAQEAAPAVRGLMNLPQSTGRLTTRPQMLGAEFKVPLDTAQQQAVLPKTQATVRTILTRALFSGPRFQQFQRLQALGINKAADDIAKEISGLKLTPRQAGEAVQFALGEFNTIAGKQYDDAVQQVIAKGGGSAPIPAGKVADVAQGIIDDLEGSIAKAPELGQIEAIQSTVNMLKGIAGWRTRASSTHVQPIRQARGMAPNTATGPLGEAIADIPSPVGSGGVVGERVTRGAGPEVEAHVTFEEARRLRTLLFKLTEQPDLSLGRGRVAQVTAALDEAMQQGLKDAGMADMASTFRQASNRYRSAMDTLETGLIHAAAKQDAPEVILGQMLGSKSETAFTAFNAAAQENPGIRDGVRRAAWEHLFSESTSEGIAIGNKMERTLEKIGDEALQEIFGAATTAKIKRFSEVVNLASLPAALKRPPTEQAASLMVQGQVGALSFAPTLGTWVVGGTVLPAVVMSRLMTRKGAVDLAIRAAQTPRNTEAGAKIAARLLSLAGRGIPMMRAQGNE